MNRSLREVKGRDLDDSVTVCWVETKYWIASVPIVCICCKHWQLVVRTAKLFVQQLYALRCFCAVATLLFHDAAQALVCISNSPVSVPHPFYALHKPLT